MSTRSYTMHDRVRRSDGQSAVA